jgi:hypothetical protein
VKTDRSYADLPKATTSLSSTVNLYLVMPTTCGHCRRSRVTERHHKLYYQTQGIRMSQWQPIETAPQDGKAILGYADGIMTTVTWSGRYWNLCEAGSFAEDGEWNPTHWMPLPEPPAEAKTP